MAQKDRIFHVSCLFDGADLFAADCAVCVRDGRIAGIVEKTKGEPGGGKLLRSFDGAEQIRLPRGFLLPGLVNAHHHAYSALARGLEPAGPMPDFRSRLENLWWRFDNVLDEEAIRLSAAVTALDCIRQGCTAVIDHHSSPSAIDGSLDRAAAGFGDLAMTRVLCYETSDRNGPEAVDQAIDENIAFAAKHAGSKEVGSLFGLHASFTLSGATLKRIARDKPAGLGVHLHAAEDLCDVEHARAENFDGPLARLDSFGLLNDGGIAAHCLHLAPGEFALLSRRGLSIAHTVESNLNNRVGYADLDRFGEDRILLGTDGFCSAMTAALRAAYLLYSGMGGGKRDALTLGRRLLFDNPAGFLSRLLGRPVGRVTVGEPADFAIFDYPSPTPVDEKNWVAHIVYGLSAAPGATWVYAGGKPVLEAGRITAVDEDALLAEAGKLAARLRDDYQKKPWRGV